MKLKHILSALLLGAVTFTSCSDFLEETPYNKIVPGNFYTTYDGITGGVNGLYARLRKLYITEAFMNVCENETDITIWPSSQGRQPVNASTSYVRDLWNACYININQCNEVIYALNNYDITDLTEDMKKRYLAEARFIRALLYSHLVKQWGDVPLKLSPTSSVDTYANRAKEADVWNAIIEDFEYAKDNLPQSYDKATEYGRATCWAAMHELSKSLLTCKRDDPAALEIALDYAERIINSKQFELMSSTYNLWSMDYVRDNKEVIFAVCYSKDNLLNGDGNQSHMYFVADYTRYHKAMTRTLEYGRPWVRCKPTLYAYQLFYTKRSDGKDGTADERAKGCFMWEFNKCTTTAYSETMYSHLDNAVINLSIPRTSTDPKYSSLWAFQGGANRTMVCFPWYSNPDFTTEEINKIKTEIRNLWPVWVYLPENMQVVVENTGGIESANNPYDKANPNAHWPSNVKFNDIFFYPYLRKHLDPTRPDANYEEGTRDVFVSRLADTYLLAAEAALLLGDKTKATKYVNVVRERAAVNDANKPAMRITEDQLTLDFLLDERGRELIGEMHRRYDLKRFGKLTERMNDLHDRIWYFDPAYQFEEYMEKRPYPRDFLMSISNPQDFKNDERYGN